MYEILGKYGNDKAERIDEFETRDEAERMMDEYRMSFGSCFTLWIKKVRS